MGSRLGASRVLLWLRLGREVSLVSPLYPFFVYQNIYIYIYIADHFSEDSNNDLKYKDFSLITETLTPLNM